jgi:putative transposase
MAKYDKETKQSNIQSPIQLTLDQIVLEGAKRFLGELVDAELTEYLGRMRYEHHSPDSEKKYRNGYGKKRHVTVGSGSIPIRLPRLREPWESHILKRYQRYSEGMQELVPQLYLHGLSTGDFEQCLAPFLGQEAPLSPSTIVRMKQEWEIEYAQWKKRPLEEAYLYVWADGVYPKAGPKDEDMAVLVVVGVNRRGEKELLAIEEGYRESYESWREVFRQIKKHGTRWVGLMIADGMRGLWKALRDVFPGSRHQRCFVHKMRNVLDNVPSKAQDEVRDQLRLIYHARSHKEALALRKEFIMRYRKLYPKAVASLMEAGEKLFSYFHFPKHHWRSIKSTNVIESMFATVKLRTDAARRIRKRESGLYLVFKLLTNHQLRMKKLHGCKLVAETIDTLTTARSKRRNAA